MGAVHAALVTCWTALIGAAYWPSFRFPPSWILDAFSPQGFRLIPSAVAGAFAGHVAGFAVAGLVLLSATGFGRRAFRLVRPGADPLLAHLPLGLALAGLAALGFGLAGLLNGPVAWAVVLGGIAAGGLPRGLRLFPAGVSRAIWILAVLVALPALLGALVPEVTYDALAYHLGAPELFLRHHRVVRLEHMFFTDFPLPLQMLYGLGGCIGGDFRSAKAIHFILGLACVGAAWRLGAAAFGRFSANWAAAFMVATPFLVTLMMKANVDLGVVLATSGGAWFLVAGGGARSFAAAGNPVAGTAALAAAGLLLGAATAMKLTGGLGLVAAAVVIALQPRFGRSLSVFAAGAAIPLVPWLVKSWLMTGNPAYPFLLGGEGWTPSCAAAYRSDMSGPTSFNVQYGGPTGAAAAPWLFFMHDRGGEAALGPFVLTLVPLALIARGFFRERAARLAVFAAAYWAAWALAVRDPRFCLPAWPAACAVAAGVLASASGPAGAVLRITSLAAVAFAPAFSASLSFRLLNPGPCAWGVLPREAYEQKLVPPPDAYMPAARAAGSFFGAGERVLVVGDVKGARLSPLPVYSSMFDVPHLQAWTLASPTPERLGKRFRQARIAGVMYNAAGAAYLGRQFGHFSFNPAQRRTLAAFWSSGLDRVWTGNVYTLYRVRPFRRGIPPAGKVPGEGG